MDDEVSVGTSQGNHMVEGSSILKQGMLTAEFDDVGICETFNTKENSKTNKEERTETSRRSTGREKKKHR
jgi:hypothetical protein